MKVLYLTGIPSPYRVELFNEMGKLCELDVLFLAEYQADRNKQWQSVKPESFQAFYMNRGPLRDKKIDLSMLHYLKRHANQYDLIVVHGISSIPRFFAMRWMIQKGVSYGLEADGALIPRSEAKPKYALKKYFISHAKYCLSTSGITTDWYIHYGASKERCYHYPFTSLTERDAYQSVYLSPDEKNELKQKMGCDFARILIVHGTRALKNRSFDAEEESDTGILLIDNEGEDTLPADALPDYIRKIPEDELLDHVDELLCADAFLSSDETNDCLLPVAAALGLPIISYRNEAKSSSGTVGDLRIRRLDKNDPNQTSQLKAFLFEENEQEPYRISSFTYFARRCSGEAAASANPYAVLTHLLKRKRSIIKNNMGLDDSTPVVLLVGQIIPRKGIDILLRASLLLPKNIKYLVVGGACTTELQEIIDQNGIRNVEFIDFVSKEDLRRYYSMCDVFALPTREDIWGLVINEAMAYCLPIVTTDNCIAGIELVPKDCIIPTNDSEALAKKIKELLAASDNPAYYCKLIERSIKATLEYTIENSARVHMDVFGMCAGNGEA